jgi:uncharacterized protein YqjF (DUF2071 family)
LRGHHVTVLTADDLRQSPAIDLAATLARETFAACQASDHHMETKPQEGLQGDRDSVAAARRNPAMARRPFLRARWFDLLLVTYAVPDDVLAPRLPVGLELDRWQGHALVSLVAFDFADTRVRGLAWPGFVRFPELNLRFYVRDGERRGVCFVREYVPSRLVSWLARTLYNEPYCGVPYRKDSAAHVLAVGGREHRIAWTCGGELQTPPQDSLAHFLKEHEWGFGVKRSGEPTCYRVEHPVWRIWPTVEHRLDVDFGVLYGPPFARLNDAPPLSAIAAEGSAVAVYPAEPRGTR